MGTRGQFDAWLLSLVLAAGALACADDGEDEAPPERDSGNGFTDPKDTEDASRADGARPDAGTPREDAGSEDGDTPDGGESCEASEAEAEEKEWATGCYKCVPESNAQLLNSCATGWRTFDPANYPDGWEPGEELPALP